MFFDINWHITIGRYRLAMLEEVEIHKSIDLLADTCTIKVPGSVYNKALRVEDESGRDKIVRGDTVLVKLGYGSELREEFRGYLLSLSTDDGSITMQCENDLFLMRKAVRDKEFVKKTVRQIAQYLVDETGVLLQVNCTLTIDYDKFVIHNATAYDVLKKLQEETKGNIYIREGELHIHPPYVEHHGRVSYSFQQNIEKSDLKYRKAQDKSIQVVVENTGADGKVKTVTAGTTGGDKITISGAGLSEAAMKQLANNEYTRNLYDGYEGSITGWLVPHCDKGFSCKIVDEDYEYKDGVYFVNAVTTTVSGTGGGERKVQLGKKLG